MKIKSIIQNKVEELFPEFKYEIVSSANTATLSQDPAYKCLPNPITKMDLARNLSREALIKAFRITFRADGNCLFEIDFKDEIALERFSKFCNEEIKTLLRSSNEGLFQHKANPRSFNNPVVPFSIFVTKSLDENKQLVDDVLLAIHQTDPLDQQTIRLLDAKNLEEFNSTKKTAIIDHLNKAYGRGNTIGFFAHSQNSLVSAGAARFGKEELDEEAKQIRKNGLSLK